MLLFSTSSQDASLFICFPAKFISDIHIRNCHTVNQLVNVSVRQMSVCKQNVSVELLICFIMSTSLCCFNPVFVLGKQ